MAAASDNGSGRGPRAKDLLRGARPLVCGWCTVPSAFGAELVARSGVDLVAVDMQHGLLGHDTALAMLQVTTAAGIPTLVRVAHPEPAALMHALDAGADGVIAPMVETAEQARQMVRACRYPPAGDRSWGPARAALLGGDDPREADARAVCVVMVETPEAIDRIDAIAATEGIDAVLVGSNDLALAMAGGAAHPREVKATDAYHERLQQVADACARHQVPAGAAVGSPEEGERLRAMGYRLLVIRSDAALLREAVAREARAVRGAPDHAPAMTGQY